MKDELIPGLNAETSFVVGNRHLANEVGSGMVSVFSTAMMIAGMEAAAVKCVQKFLDPGYTTVGVHVDVEHKAPTPLGSAVHFRATLEEHAGRRFVFHVEAWDAAGPIGEGKHWRVAVLQEQFERKALDRVATRSA